VRTLEILTIIIILGALAALFTQKNRTIFLYAILAAIIIAITQFFIEGLRWQFLPAIYIMPFMYASHRYYSGILNRLLKTVLILWVLIALILPWVIPVFNLPHPRGEFDVGTETFHWVDSSRLEWFTPEKPGDLREIMAQVWYPGDNTGSFEPEPYLDNIDLRGKTIAAAGRLPSFLPGHLEYVKTNSYKNIACTKQVKNLPILIFSHGITGSRHLHQVLFEYLASRGYVVIAPDHSFDANLTVFPDQRIADYRSDITGLPDSINIRRKQLDTRRADIHFLINQLEKIQTKQIRSVLNKKLDLENIALGGHSYGGATALISTYQDKRIKACIVFDSWVSPLPEKIIADGIDVPLLFMGRPTWDNSDYPNNYMLLDSLMSSSLNPKYHLIIQKTKHLDYTDIPLFSPIIKYVMDVGDLSSDISLPLVNVLTHSFLDKYLVEKNSNRFNDAIKNNLIIHL